MAGRISPLSKLTPILIALVGIIAMTLGSWSCSAKAETVTIGITPNQAYSLIYIAQDQRFFIKNGIDLVEKYYEHGAIAADALAIGEIDIAGSSENPIASKALEKRQVSIIANVNKYEGMYLVSLKDKGIQSVSDLKGKRVGLLRNSIVEFYLDRALFLNGVNKQDVTLMDSVPPQAEEDILKGSLDAAVVWEPYVSQIGEKLADNTVAWSVQSNQLGYGVIIARKDWISGHQKTINRFLKSLNQAESFIIHNPEAAKRIVKKRLNYDDAFMNVFWSQNQFSLSLDQSLITAMEDEARWMIANNLTTEKQVPNFLDYIYEDGLKAVKPGAVSIIR